MPDWNQIARHAREQDGAVSLAQLRAAGMSDDQVRRACVAGQLHRRHRGAFVVGGDIPSRYARIWAGYLAVGPDVWVDGLTSLELLGLHERVGEEIHLGCATRRRSRGLLRVHEGPRVQQRHLWRARGMLVAAPPLALLGASLTLEDDRLAVVVANIVAKRKTSLPKLDQILGDFAGHHGCPRLARVVDGERSDPGFGRTSAEMEARFLPMLRALPDLPRYLRNERLELEPGYVVVPDVWFPGPRVWLELDSRTWHERRRTMDADRRKDQRAVALGVVPFRITWQHLLHEWDAVAADLLAVLRRVQ